MKGRIRPGFVIGVIGAGVGVFLMAGMFFGNVTPHSHGIGQKGVRTQNTLSALQQAVERFQSEYSKLPETGASDFTTEDDAGRELLTVLLGKEETGIDMQNPRQVPFLNATVAKNRKYGGLVYGTDPIAAVEGLFDSWGNPFRVILDADRDGVIRFDYGGKPQEVRGKHSLVLSKGRDGIEGTKDDVKSW